MKKIIFILVILCPALLRAQKRSALFDKLNELAPERWSVKERNDTIVLTCPDSVWFYNPINEPVRMGNDTAPPFGANKTIYRMYVRYSPRWGARMLADAKEKNEAISKKITELYGYYGIAKMPHKFDDYIPANDDEKNRLEKYRAEEKTLRARLTDVPDYNWKDCSIWFPYRMYYIGIWPESASQKIYELEQTIRTELSKEK